MTYRQKTHASLCSGIGGPEIAAHNLNWKNVFSCEIDPFCKTVLQYHFKNSIHYEDIFKTDFTIHRGKIDVLSGGFPCQPFSHAGKGKGTKDERFIWPQVLRAIREIQPVYFVGENVYGLITNQNGMVFEQICVDLENEGYEVQSYLLPVAGANGIHTRQRLFIVAYSNINGRKAIQSNTRGVNKKNELPKRRSKKIARKQMPSELDPGTLPFLPFREMHGEPEVFAMDDALPFKLDGITVPKFIQETLRAAGNSIDPLVIKKVFSVIDRMI